MLSFQSLRKELYQYSYCNTKTSTDDLAHRIFTAVLTDELITSWVSGAVRFTGILVCADNPVLIGDATNQFISLAVGDSITVTEIDISSAYMINTGAGNNGTINYFGNLVYEEVKAV